MYERVVREPRLTAGWSTDAEDDTIPDILRDMAGALSRRYGVGFDRVWVNLYRDGSDSVAGHGDRNRLVMTRPLVATVSLGARRAFRLRPRGTGAVVYELAPGLGDLVVMGGSCEAEGEQRLREPTSAGPGHAW